MPDTQSMVGDWSFMTTIDATPSKQPFTPEPFVVVSKTTGDLMAGGKISLENVPAEWKHLPVFLNEKSLPFVFYISDQNLAHRAYNYMTRSFRYKFHFRWCSTLETMQRQGRIQKYRAKYDICSPDFEINDGNYTKKLKVCLNCCNEFNQAYHFFAATKETIIDKFDMPKFFDKFGKINLPTSTHPGGGDSYTRDWPKVARREKERANWKCQDCQRDCINGKSNLHVHHKNGVKSHNVSDNLEIVCRACHARKPGHGHMRL